VPRAIEGEDVDLVRAPRASHRLEDLRKIGVHVDAADLHEMAAVEIDVGNAADRAARDEEETTGGSLGDRALRRPLDGVDGDGECPDAARSPLLGREPRQFRGPDHLAGVEGGVAPPLARLEPHPFADRDLADRRRKRCGQ
jgi:hypothetical protein